MCGIAGIICEQADLKSAVRAMVAAQAHRGPDDHGTREWTVGNTSIAFGHTRLSIIDLSPAGHQPMLDPESGSALIFNGEIYNFRELRRELESGGAVFRSTCDSEVLLAALVRWGPTCLARLEGMFAFAFFDARKRAVMLARDPLG